MFSVKVRLIIIASLLLLLSTTLLSAFTYIPFFTSSINIAQTSSFQHSFEVSINQKSQDTRTLLYETNELNVFAADFNYSTSWIKKLTVIPSKYNMYEKAYELSFQ